MESEPITADTALRPSRQSRAATALFIAGAFTVFAILVYRGTISSVPAIGTITVAGPVIAAVVELVVAFGLASRRRWANVAMTPVLWILALSGVLTFLASLLGGRLDIPIGAILMIWALRAPVSSTVESCAGPVDAERARINPRRRPPGRGCMAGDRAERHPTGGTAARVVHGPPPRACRDALCRRSGRGPDGPPDAVDVVVHWTWARAEPVRAGIDAIVLSWATMGGPEGSGGYYLDEPVQQEPGITEEDRSGVLAVYRNDLTIRGFEPGTVTIRLRRPNELAPGPGLVQIAVTYAHHYNGQFGTTPAGLWTRAQVTNCDW